MTSRATAATNSDHVVVARRFLLEETRVVPDDGCEGRVRLVGDLVDGLRQHRVVEVLDRFGLHGDRFGFHRSVVDEG